MEVCPYSYFRLCGYIWVGPWVSFVTTDEFSVKVTKTTSRISVSLTHSLPFCFLPIFNSLKWPYEIDVNQVNLFSWNWWSAWTLGSLTVTVTILLFWISFFLVTLVFVPQWLPPIGWFWSCCLSFHWLSVKLKTGFPVSSHYLWILSCWLRRSLWSFERFARDL